mmetsp:Transcript_3235/g.4401  ORF Transcript_3235/g.4401 Transcript_3235/m.4401 type:complete len:335 (-) Transcript_3235:409-1413(-)
MCDKQQFRGLVDVVLLIEGTSGSRMLTFELAKGSISVSLGESVEKLLSTLNVFSLSIPSLKHGSLESTAEGEGKLPRSVRVKLVHSIKVAGSFLLGLTSRKEGDTRNSGRKSAHEPLNSVLSDFFRRSGLARVSSRKDHVRLKKHTLPLDVNVGESLHGSSLNLLGNPSLNLNSMSSIHKHLRLDDRDETIHLADLSVLCESASVSFNSFHRRSAVGVNAEDTAPLSEASSLLVVLSSTLSKSVDSFGDGLSIHEGCADAGVDLDTGNNVVSLHNVNERSSILSILEEGLFVQNSRRDSLVHLRCAEEEFAPLATVGLFVRDANLLKALTDGLG